MRTTLTALCLLAVCSLATAQVYNLKIVTDAGPDYSDMPSMIHSITANWAEPKDKCWAMFYWMHLARRQTTPMSLHGWDLSDPIMQANDFGYTMCSTVSGVNCGIWANMGLKSRYWDISHHTVSEVFYDDKWHLYDDSLSAVYTLCDGRTIAGVEDIGAEGACAASGGKKEKGHVALYHCLHATSPCGFVQGADVGRDLMQEVNSFAPEVLKRRDYHDWNWGHRYILNLRPGDVYARNYRRIDKTSANDDYFSPEGYTSDVRYFVPNPHIQASTEKTATTVPAARTNGDPEIANPRYFIRGNGEWMLTAPVTEDFQKRAFSSVNLKFVKDKGLVVDKGGEAAEVVYHFSSANVMTSMWMTVNWAGAKPPTLSISVDRGATWLPVAQTSKDIVEKEAISTYLCTPPDVNKSLMAVNGRYQVLVKAVLAGDTAMSSLDVHLVTQLNTKTQPRLNIGKNTVYVGTGEQTDSIVYFPDLQSEKDKTLASAMENVKAFGAVGYAPAVSLAKGGTGSITFKMVAPDEITSLTYGAKMCTREKGSRVEFQHSFDGGDTWVTDYTQEENLPDPIHYVTVDKVPAGTKTVQYKYVLVGKATDGNQLGLSEVRMEADHKAPASKAPLAITFAWREVMPGGGLFDRAHTEKVTQLPHKYTINVGGLDHPQMVSLTVSAVGDADVTPGYSDRREGRAKKWEGRWVKYGTVLTLGKKYTVSVPSLDWRGGKDDGVRMTDGVIGPLYAGGNIPKWGMVWLAGSEPVITVDMEKEQDCGAFRFHMATWPWWDALKGQMQDKVEVLTSLDGKEYTSHGLFNLELRRKDVPINHMLPDEETAMGWVFEKLLEKPVKARFVQFKFTIVPVEGKSKDERKAVVTEVQALDKIEYEPFDLKITEPLWMK